MESKSITNKTIEELNEKFNVRVMSETVKLIGEVLIYGPVTLDKKRGQPRNERQ